MLVQIIKLDPSVSLPEYKTDGAAGMDLCANQDCTIGPGHRILVKTGLAIAVPHGYEAQVRPRSGTALKEGVTVLNSPGTIDSDYRGEIGVILYNTRHDHFVVKKGDRIAQLVVAPVVRVVWDEVSALPETTRGEGGFGSTGK